MEEQKQKLEWSGKGLPSVAHKYILHCWRACLATVDGISSAMQSTFVLRKLILLNAPY